MKIQFGGVDRSTEWHSVGVFLRSGTPCCVFASFFVQFPSFGEADAEHPSGAKCLFYIQPVAQELKPSRCQSVVQYNEDTVCHPSKNFVIIA